MGEAITATILALAVFGLSYLGCLFALLPFRASVLAMLSRKLDDPEMTTRLVQLRSAFNLCEQQLAHQFDVSKRRLAEIHRLQAEVRALKFEREAREAEATEGSQ